ncbi:MAG: transcriptional regulator [Erysipelotrichaceae bacterium]|nr:transcriptional regulator [Erysipelotrichaceae bacterium]
MNYQEMTKELLQYMADYDTPSRVLQQNMFECTRGELGVLIYLIEEKDGAHARDISQKLNVNTSRVAALLNTLSNKGYIVRCPDENDKRKIKVFITNDGRAYADARRDEVEKYMSHLLYELGEEDAMNFIRIIKRITHIMQNG